MEKTKGLAAKTNINNLQPLSNDNGSKQATQCDASKTVACTNTHKLRKITQVLHTLHTTMTNGQTEPNGVQESICENCLYFKTEENSRSKV